MTLSFKLDADPQQERSVALLFAGRLSDAFDEAKMALRANPFAPEPLLVLAAIASEHRNHSKALELATLSLQRGETAWGYALRGRSRLALHQLADARRDARYAAAHPPGRPEIADMVGVLLARAGLHQLSTPYFEAAVAAAPARPSFLYNLATGLQFSGDLKRAAFFYRELIKRAPGHHRARLALVELEKQTADANRLDELRAIFDGTHDANDRALIGHAIAKSYEDLEEWDRSFAWLGRAKEAKLARSTFDRAALEALVKAATGSISRTSPSSASSEAAPIFIVGMPRSGTTLVERILGNHSAVESAGELSDFAILLKRAVGTAGPLVLDAATIDASGNADLAQVGRNYAEGARQIVGDVPRFIDKMPFNIFYVPAILRALPNAKVICLRRDPADTMLSNYRQLFATDFPYYDYALRLEDSAAMVAGFERIADCYRAQLPPERYCEIHYEEIVADLAGNARRLLAFCDLPFEEACLSPERNRSPVATASSAQVRKAVYTTSIGRWRRYPEASAQMIAALDQEGIRIDR